MIERLVVDSFTGGYWDVSNECQTHYEGLPHVNSVWAVALAVKHGLVV